MPQDDSGPDDHDRGAAAIFSDAMTEGILRVLIADDHTMFRRGVPFCLSRVPEVEVVGDASDGETAVTLKTELAPDLELNEIRSIPHCFQDGFGPCRGVSRRTAGVLRLGVAAGQKHDH
jgi:hypothetical protein